MLAGLTSYELTEWAAYFKFEQMRQDQGGSAPEATPQDAIEERFAALGGRERPKMDNSIRYDEPLPDHLFE